MDEFVIRDEPLSAHSTFKIGGPARYFARPRDLTELQSCFEFAHSESIPWIVIGKGSNILFSDDAYDGLVVTLTGYRRDYFKVADREVDVSAGFSLSKFARLLAEHSLGGMEFAGTIPGSVGGALIMNAGYGKIPGVMSQMGDSVASVTVMDPDGRIGELKREDINFGYRTSDLAGKIVLEAKFRLMPKDKNLIVAEMKENELNRGKTQDLRYPSAGSVFKNPSGAPHSAGKMIDLAGLKGFRIGNAQISIKHGNFIINLGQARAEHVMELIGIARTRVKELFGISLETEIQYVSSGAAALTSQHGRF